MVSLNTAEINAVLNELQLTGSHLIKINQSDYSSLALRFAKDGQNVDVLISMNSASFLARTQGLGAKRAKPLRFMQCLNAHITPFLVERVYQYEYERLVMFHVKHEDSRFMLVVRLWGPRSNIFLCHEDWSIVDCFYRRPKSGEISGEVLGLPKPKDRSENLYEQRFVNDGTVSEQIRQLYGVTQELGAKPPVEEVIKAYFAEKLRQNTGEQQRCSQLKAEYAQAPCYKEIGDGLLTLGSQVDGEKCVPDEWLAYLNPVGKNLIKSAHLCYEKNKKQQRKEELLAQKTTELAQRAMELHEQEHQALTAGVWPLGGAHKKVVKPNTKPRVGLSCEIKGFLVLIGRNADENDRLLREHSRGLDYWFHVFGHSGGYVLIKTQRNKQPSNEVVLGACALAQHFSSVRGQPEVVVQTTQVKHLKRAKKAPKGQVLVEQERRMSYYYDKERIDGILKQFG